MKHYSKEIAIASTQCKTYTAVSQGRDGAAWEPLGLGHWCDFYIFHLPRTSKLYSYRIVIWSSTLSERKVLCNSTINSRVKWKVFNGEFSSFIDENGLVYGFRYDSGTLLLLVYVY